MPEVLSIDEVDLLPNQLHQKTPKGVRDRAMLSFYATGIRVSELINLQMSEINMQLAYITCTEHEKERIIPFGNPAKRAAEQYMKEGRPAFDGGEEGDFVFVNCSGKPMSRQGFWKVLKGYASQAGITADITPQVRCATPLPRICFRTEQICTVSRRCQLFRYFYYTDVSELLEPCKMRDVYKSPSA